MRTRSRSLSRWALAWVLMLAGCGSPTSPRPPATAHRTVGFAVTDSLGAVVADANVTVTSPDSAGFDQLLALTTDAAGRCQAVLAQGTAFVHVQAAANQVAGSSLRIPGAERALADTLLVRLRLGTASRARGTVTLQTRNDHSGTFVTVNGAAGFAATDSTGAYDLGGLPPGHWTIAFAHPGYAPAFTTLDVVQPGSLVSVPPLQLQVMTREP